MKKVLSVMLAVCLCLAISTCVAESKTYEVGVVQLVQHVALDAATQGFIDALTEKLGDSVHVTVKNASGDSANCITIANDFVSANVDLIMANATPALQACVGATADIPILGTSITDYATALASDDWTGVTGINVSGTSDLAPLDGQAAMLNELFPDAKTVGLIYCSAEPNSLYQVTEITKYLEGYGYECKAYAFADSNDVASVVTQACECDVLYAPTDNTVATYGETVANVIVPAGKALIAGEEGICSNCGVATLTISYYDLGYATGLMAYDVLTGESVISETAIQYAPTFTKKYNPEMCETLGIVVPEDYTAIE